MRQPFIVLNSSSIMRLARTAAVIVTEKSRHGAGFFKIYFQEINHVVLSLHRG